MLGGERRGRAPRGSAQTLALKKKKRKKKKGRKREDKVFACWTGHLKDGNKKVFFSVVGKEKTALLCLGRAMGALVLHEGSGSAGTQHL